MRGRRIIVGSWVGTALFTAIAGVAVVSSSVRSVAVGVDLALFAVGIVTFLSAYGIAIARSRTDAIGIGGLFFLVGDSAPAEVRRHLMAALATQIVVALLTASLRPFTSAAFAILVPVYGLGLAGLWGARHGHFSPRT